MHQDVTLKMPEELYERVKQRAQEMNRSVEDEIVVAVETTLSTQNGFSGIPTDIADEMKQLRFLNDADLWRAARMTVPEEKSDRMQALILKQQSEGLTEKEQKEAKQLRHLADRVTLVRAEAAVILKERGFDISELRQSPRE